MKTASRRKPYLTTLIITGGVAVFELFLYTQNVFAQPVALAILADDAGLKPMLEIAQVVVMIFTAIAFISGFVWYVVRGKSSEQLKATVDQLKESNADYRARVADLKNEVTELEKENESLRKKNLRLQGAGEL